MQTSVQCKYGRLLSSTSLVSLLCFASSFSFPVDFATDADDAVLGPFDVLDVAEVVALEDLGAMQVCFEDRPADLDVVVRFDTGCPVRTQLLMLMLLLRMLLSIF